jgi:hypothetical protein
MPLDQATLKLRWGITGTDQDALVDQVAEQAQALCETYTGRRFDFGPDAGDFDGVAGSFQVPRYPIKKITKLHAWLAGRLPEDPTEGAGITGYRLNKAHGLVWPGAWHAQLHCEWEGGFETWPVDLAYAVTIAADIIWSDTPGGGAPVGSAGGASLGAIKKLSVVGVYSAELSEGDSGGGADGDSTWGVLPPTVTSVLDRYRMAAVVGIG